MPATPTVVRDSRPSTHQPKISVVIPTMGRPDKLLRLIETLNQQTVSPADLELLIVIDSDEDDPAALRAADVRAPVLVLQQPNQGPAAARNRAIEVARAPLLLILNDDALVAADVVERHLERQAAAEGPEAVLGRFDFTPAVLRSPLARLFTLNDSYMFNYSALTPDGLHPGTRFWTCNLSVPTALVRAVGGFDERFRHAIGEDTELGVRLEVNFGLKVRYSPSILAWHDHVQEIRPYRRRQVLAGYYTSWITDAFGDSERVLHTRQRAGLDLPAVQLRADADRLRTSADAAVQGWEQVLVRTPPGQDPALSWPELDHVTLVVAKQALVVGAALFVDKWPAERLLSAEGRMDAPPLLRSGPVTSPALLLQLLRARTERVVAWVAPGTLLPQAELATLHKQLSWWPDVVATGPSWLPAGGRPADPRLTLQALSARNAEAQRDGAAPAEWPDELDPRVLLIDRPALLEAIGDQIPPTWSALWGTIRSAGRRVRRALDVWAAGA